MMNVLWFTICRSDCEHFGMEYPDFPEAEELKEDLNKHQTMWGMFEKFNAGMQDLAKEDWISFRLEYF